MWIGFDRSDQKEPEFTCICCLSPWVGIKQAAMHLFTMSKDPACRHPKVSRQPNLLSDLRRMVVGIGGWPGPGVAAKGSEAWWSRTESNRRHPACKAGALPTELRPLFRRWPRQAKLPKGSEDWWARVDSNYRPHAYQACALTT